MENLLPPLPSDTLSAADVFGAMSEIALRSGSAYTASAVAGDAVLQFAALAVALLYIYTVVRYSDVVMAILFSTVGVTPSKGGGQRHYNFALMRNVEIVVALAGAVAAAVVAVRIVGSPATQASLPAGAPAAACMIMAGIALLALAEYSAVRIVGSVSGRKDVCSSILQIKLRHFSAAVAFVLPTGMLFIFAAPSVAGVCFYIMAAQCFISAILFAKETFSLFIAERVSILYWILYLCTLEVFPVSILLAPVMRAG